VIVVEVDDEPDRKLCERPDWAGPDRRAHGEQVVPGKILRISVLEQEFANRGLVVALDDEIPGFSIKSQDVGQHSIESRPQQVATLREQRIQRMAVIFQAAPVVAHAETHRCRPRCNAEFVEQPNEMRIRPVVKHDEACVDGVTLAVKFEIDRVRMAARIVVGFKHRDVVLGAQPIRRHKSRNARTNHSNFHG